MIEAVSRGWYKKVRRISQMKYHVSTTTDYYKYAVKTNVETVKELLKIKTIKTITDSALIPVFNRHKSQQKYDMLEFLLRDVGLDINIMHEEENKYILFYNRDDQIIDILIRYGLNINIKNYGCPLLFKYIQHTNLDIIKILLDHDVDYCATDIYDNNILHYFFSNDNIFSIFKKYEYYDEKKYILDLVTKLLDHGVDPYHENSHGQIAIFRALVYIKDFIQEYINVNVKDPGYD
jgi:ankyrin repeat protein